MSFALFNILVLVSRLSNSALGPFLAKRIEVRLVDDGGDGAARRFPAGADGRPTARCCVGILLVPTAQRLFSRAIGYFQEHRSTTRCCCRARHLSGLRTIRESLAMPARTSDAG